MEALAVVEALDRGEQVPFGLVVGGIGPVVDQPGFQGYLGGRSQRKEAILSPFDTKQTSQAPDAVAPDGSEVRVLCQVGRGSMAQFALPPGAVSRAVAHRTVEEVWCFVSGQGRMWRRLGNCQETVEVGPGTSVSIPAGVGFQFRCDSGEPLVAVGVTMPPWPGEAEAHAVEGCWPPTA